MTNNVRTFTQTAGVERDRMCAALDAIRDQILHQQDCTAQSFLEIGRLLLEAKSFLGKHGEWINWLTESVDMSLTKAQRLMKVARYFGENEAPVLHLEFSKAYILTRVPSNELENFLQNFCRIDGKMKQVKDMSKRELESVVRNYMKSRRRKTAAANSKKKQKPASTLEDDIYDQFEAVKARIDEILAFVGESQNDETARSLLIMELHDLCRNILQELSDEDLETI